MSISSVNILKSSQIAFCMIAIILAIVVGGCPNDSGVSEKYDSDSSTLTRGEHDRDGGEHS